MTIAPNSGDQPCLIKSLTNEFRRVKAVQDNDDNITRMPRMNGNGVLTKLIRAAETTPTRQRVIRSPRQAAMGGAMLSIF
jgi:hypothetical protein